MYLESTEMWCWGRMQKISWTDRERNEVLHDVKEERNILQTTKRRKANWTGHSWRRNCLLKHVIKGKIEGKRRRGRRGKQLLDELMENRSSFTALYLLICETQNTKGHILLIIYEGNRICWNLKWEALDRTL